VLAPLVAFALSKALGFETVADLAKLRRCHEHIVRDCLLGDGKEWRAQLIFSVPFILSSPLGIIICLHSCAAVDVLVFFGKHLFLLSVCLSLY